MSYKDWMNGSGRLDLSAATRYRKPTKAALSQKRRHRVEDARERVKGDDLDCLLEEIEHSNG